MQECSSGAAKIPMQDRQAAPLGLGDAWNSFILNMVNKQTRSVTFPKATK